MVAKMTFLQACADGNIDLAKTLYIEDDKQKALLSSCKYGHLEIAKWLHSLGANIHHEYALVPACNHQRLHFFFLTLTGNQTMQRA